MPGRHQPGGRADTALEAKTAHAGASPDRAFGWRLALLRTGRRPCRLPGDHDIGRCNLHPAGIRQEAVVAFGHDGNDHVVGADAGILGHQQFAGSVVHPAHLHRRRQENRRLRQAPLCRGDEPGALTGAVQYRAAGRHRFAEQVAARIDDRDPGPGHAAAGRRWRLVPPDRDVTDAHARHVRYRRGRPSRQHPYPDAQVAGPGGPAIR